MKTHAAPSGGVPWDTFGGCLGQFFLARRDYLYILVALRGVGAGGTTAPVTHFPRKTFPRPVLRLPPLGVECDPKTTRAALGLCHGCHRLLWTALVLLRTFFHTLLVGLV